MTRLSQRRARYTKYYEHDGQLRAYANRSMLMAGLFGVIALVSLSFAIYVRLQPPTVIRVSADGEATVVGGRPAGATPALTRAGLLSVLAASRRRSGARRTLRAAPWSGNSSRVICGTPPRRLTRIWRTRST